MVANPAAASGMVYSPSHGFIDPELSPVLRVYIDPEISLRITGLSWHEWSSTTLLDSTTCGRWAAINMTLS